MVTALRVAGAVLAVLATLVAWALVGGMG